MGYRTFAPPPEARTGASAGFWVDWLADQGEVLLPVAPHHALSCERCFGAARYRDEHVTWPFCFECGRVYGAAVDTVVPITYSIDAGLESILHEYKDGGKAWLRRPLSSLLTVFLRSHADCIDDDARGIDLATIVPSNNRQRAFSHLDRIVEGTVSGQPVLNLFDWNPDVLARDWSRTRPGRGELKSDAYVVNVDVSNAAVLLFDDTWTSGASAASSAAALKEAGAAHVTVLTLGRQLNARSHFGSTDAIYAERSVVSWSRGVCVMCA